MNYEMTEHARDVLQERQIPIAWMERVGTAGAERVEPKRPLGRKPVRQNR